MRVFLLCVLVLAGCSGGAAMVIPGAPDWVLGPADPLDYAGPADGDTPTSHTWQGWLRFGANGSQAGHERNSARSGEFQCGNPPSEKKHCQVTFNVNRTIRDGEMLRVRLRYTNKKNVTREVYGLIRDSGNGRFSISYPACGKRMELLLDWRRGATRGIQSEAYIGVPRSTCMPQPMTNRKHLTGDLTEAASGLLQTGTGKTGIVLGPALTPVRVVN
ncbi:MAG: hypothetical protein ACYTGN_09115, partial [Planctomycetota bacterium]